MRALTALLVLFICGAANAGGERQLDILVFGATGEVGSHIVREALERGHRVTAVSRDPASIELRHENLTAARGDLLDVDSIAALVGGRDIVVTSVRGVIGDSGRPESALQYIAVENVVAALRASGNRTTRLMHVGGGGSLEVEPGVYYAEKLRKLFLPKGLEIEILGQIHALWFLRGVDDVPWTYATPPKHLTDGPRTGEFRLGGDRLMKDARGRSRVSRADFAVALIDEAERGRYVNRRYSVAY